MDSKPDGLLERFRCKGPGCGLDGKTPSLDIRIHKRLKFILEQQNSNFSCLTCILFIFVILPEERLIIQREDKEGGVGTMGPEKGSPLSPVMGRK